MSGGAAVAFTDYRIHADGFSRVLIHDRELGRRQAGRLVDITIEEQNRDLLQSVDRRARLQLFLNETVEGLSVVVISYYALSFKPLYVEGARARLGGARS